MTGEQLRRIVLEGRLVLWCGFQVETPKRVFDPMPGLVMAQMSYERGTRSANYVRWRRQLG